MFFRNLIRTYLGNKVFLASLCGEYSHEGEHEKLNFVLCLGRTAFAIKKSRSLLFLMM